MVDETEARLEGHAPLSPATLPRGDGYRIELWSPAVLLMVPLRPGREKEVLQSLDLETLPPVLGSAEASGGTLLRLGPEEALLIVEKSSDGTAPREFTGTFAIEISHGLVGLECSSAQIEALLMLDCPLDVQEKAFPVGMSTRTLFGKFEIILWRRSRTTFRLLIARSAGLSFLSYLGSVFSMQVG